MTKGRIVKGRITKDEWYPFYDFITPKDVEWGVVSGHEVELTETEYRDYNRTVKEFQEWQNRLRGMHKEER